MGLNTFVGKNIGPSLWIAGGFVVASYGFITDVRDMVTLGVQPDFIQLAGFCLFAVGVVAVLYRQHAMLEERLSPDHRAARTLEPAPTPASAPPSPVRTGKTVKVTAPRKKGAARQAETPSATDKDYLPASFAKAFIEMKRRAHTEAELNLLLRPHAGQWVRLTTYLAQVTRSGDHLYVLSRPSPNDNGDLIGVDFPMTAEPLLAPLKPGTRITFDAQLVDRQHGMKFANGVLL